MNYNYTIYCNNCYHMTKTKVGTIYICDRCGEDRRRNSIEEKEERK